jgi:hypothetical protein
MSWPSAVQKNRNSFLLKARYRARENKQFFLNSKAKIHAFDPKKRKIFPKAITKALIIISTVHLSVC